MPLQRPHQGELGRHVEEDLAARPRARSQIDVKARSTSASSRAAMAGRVRLPISVLGKVRNVYSVFGNDRVLRPILAIRRELHAPEELEPSAVTTVGPRIARAESRWICERIAACRQPASFASDCAPWFRRADELAVADRRSSKP